MNRILREKRRWREGCSFFGYSFKDVFGSSISFEGGVEERLFLIRVRVRV